MFHFHQSKDTSDCEQILNDAKASDSHADLCNSTTAESKNASATAGCATNPSEKKDVIATVLHIVSIA